MSTARNTLTPRNTFRPLFFLLLVLMMMLAACAPAAQPGAGDPTTAPTGTSGEPTPAVGSGPFNPQFLGQFKPEDILVQFAEEPTFTLPEYRFEFGRVPPFTLLADGRLIYIDEMQDFRVMEVKLTPEQAAELLAQVHELGFERLQDYTDMCQKDNAGQEMCVADASYHHMIARMPDGTLRSVRNYHTFSNEPAVYEAIYNLLTGYTHPEAVQYTPAAATLFLHPMADDGGMPTLDWPLDPALLAKADSAKDGYTALVLQGGDLTTYLGKLSSLGGTQTFEHDGKFYSGRVVPWLPGMDFSDEIAAQFPG